mgnify:CR=1 FL=1
MTFAEQNVQTGTSAQTGTNRFGDYGHMSLDPDGSTLWFTGEYIVGGNPRTRIFSFDLSASAGIGEGVITGPSFTATMNAGIITATLNGAASDKALSFDLIGIDGKTLISRTATPAGGSWSGTVDARDLSAGVYFLRIGDTSFQKVQRFVLGE